ncbi:MAG: hypothetical protein ACI82G_002129 [Bradymonadia bacterium]|jgi:hypothetical protein
MSWRFSSRHTGANSGFFTPKKGMLVFMFAAMVAAGSVLQALLVRRGVSIGVGCRQHAPASVGDSRRVRGRGAAIQLD